MQTNFLSSSSSLLLSSKGNAAKDFATSPTAFVGHRLVPLREKSSTRCINVFASKRGKEDHDHDHNHNNNSSSGGGGGGRLVDEDMIVLRLRMKELNLQQSRSSSSAECGGNWMDWEKQYYDQRFHQDVYAAVGLLQCILMNSRPSFALAMVALVSVSVPTTVGMVLFHGLQMVISGMPPPTS